MWEWGSKEEISRSVEKEWPSKGEGTSGAEVGWGRIPYQVLGHGLCPDIYGEAAQLWGVLKFTIEGPQIHRKNVIFRKSRFLQKQDRLSLAYLVPQRKIREEKQNNPHSSQQVSKKRFLRAPLRERSPTPFPSR